MPGDWGLDGVFSARVLSLNSEKTAYRIDSREPGSSRVFVFRGGAYIYETIVEGEPGNRPGGSSAPGEAGAGADASR